MTKYYVDFTNIAPDSVEIREVKDRTVDGLEIPADAVQFSFHDEGHTWLAPAYFVTEDFDIGGVEAMKKRNPGCPMLFAQRDDDPEDMQLALISWTHPEDKKWDGRFLLPLRDYVSVVDRNSGEILWPKIHH